MLLLKWQSRFLRNSTQTCNLKSEAVDNIRNGHYSRTQEKKTQMLFWVWGLVGGGGWGWGSICWHWRPKGGLSFSQLNARAVKRHWGGKNCCWFPVMSWNSLGSVQPPSYNISVAEADTYSSTCWRQLLVVQEDISRAQRQAHVKAATHPGTLTGVHNPALCPYYLHVWFSAFAESPLVNVNLEW